MSFSEEIRSLRDDGFEGSQEEHRIFREVFFGNDNGSVSKRCVVTGLIDFEPEYTKDVDTSQCSYSEISDETSPSLSKNLLKEHSCLVDKSHGGDSTSSRIGERCAFTNTNEENINAKRMKFSANGNSNDKEEQGNMLPKSSQLRESLTGTSCLPTDSVSRQVTLNLVESSGKGITYGCYLLKQRVEMARGADMDVMKSRSENSSADMDATKSRSENPSADMDATKSRLENSSADMDVTESRSQNSGPRVKKEAIGGTAVASPVSQESIASRLLDVSLSGTALENANCCSVSAKERPSGFHESNISLETDSKKHPRVLLQSFVFCLLRGAGWSIEMRKRDCRKYADKVYISPEGKVFNEFSKAWRFCGQKLLDDGYNLENINYGRVYTDVKKLWSDVLNVLKDIEEELNQTNLSGSFPHLWSVLDPFVTLVFIDRKIGLLKKGVELKAARSLSTDKKKESDADKVLKIVDTVGNVSSQGEVQDHLCDSLLPCRSSLTALERSNYDFAEQSGNGSFSKCCGNQDNGVIDHPAGVSISQNVLCSNSSEKCEWHDIDTNQTEAKLKLQELCAMKGGHKNSVRRIGRKSSKLKKIYRALVGSKDGRSEFAKYKYKDDDLLVSAIVRNKDLSFSFPKSKGKGRKERAWAKLKDHKARCQLLPRSMGEVGTRFSDAQSCNTESRTVLSWLIQARVISFNDIIQHRNIKNDAVIKDGLVTQKGIICKCCNKMLSVSEFKIHAGCELNQPCLNIFMESGMPFILCQLKAWSDEYKARKNQNQNVEPDDDQNDDSCGICGDGGELICCDNCPSTYHQRCLSIEELPEGSWYCSNCNCRICGELVNEKDMPSLFDGFKCFQCEQKYHKACLKDEAKDSDRWFCGENCKEAYTGLNSRLGMMNPISDGFSWTLLRSVGEDQKVHSPQWLAFKGECNSKLAVALSIMEECFQAMVDPRTGIHMIPQVIYSWGSDFPRLNFRGFYTIVLEKDDALISVASIRVHGTAVAEMPFIATCSDYRRQGMCRRLMDAIEEILISIKVEKMVITAIPSLVETWTRVFGFKLVEDEEKETFNNINMMVFPGTVLLQKPLCRSPNSNEEITDPRAEAVELREANVNFEEHDIGIEMGIMKNETSNLDGHLCLKEEISESMLKYLEVEVGILPGTGYAPGAPDSCRDDDAGN